MASSSSQTSLDRNPWISMRHAFHSLQHPRFTRSFRRKRFWEKKTVAGERSVTVPNVWPKSPFQSNDRISSVLSVSSVLVQSSSPSLNKDHAVECPVCMQFLPAECFFSLQTCQHRSCLSCLKMYVRIEITEGRIEISCPECPVKFHPGDIRTILNDDSLMQKYEEFMLRHVLVLDPDTRWCPAPDCSYAVIANGCASCPQLTCERPGCGTLFCYHCKQRWHPNQTCDTARAERLDIQSSLSPDLSSDHGSQGTIKSCPRCGSLIMKLDDGSCNHMTCVGCGAEFCWLCLKEISDLHYLSPSGCTFWGKKPWSRKRRILWQLGMLIGAPVGISIIAGVSFPVIIIGLPILVGRKLMAKCRHMAKRKRHLVVVSGVIASALVSPVLAAIAVGAGVPMLLACVYGVVPVSLCRDSCCSGRHSNQDSEFEIDFKSLQDDQKGSPIVTSAVAPVGDTPSKTWSSENFSFQNQSLTTRVEVVAEVSCNEDRFAVDDRLKEYSDDAVGVRRTLAFAGTGVDSDKASDNQGELSKSCLVRFSDSDGSVYAAHPRACSLSASAVVAESTGANSSSSSSESVRPFHHGKKLFPDGGSDVHGGGAAYDAACHTVKSLKRQCMSVGDSIDEKAKVERGYLSLHSLAEEESCLESFAGGSDIVAMVAVSEENPTADSHHAKPRAIRSSTSVAGALVTETNGRCQAEKLSSMTEAKGPAEKRRSSCRTRVLFAEDYSSK